MKLETKTLAAMLDRELFEQCRQALDVRLTSALQPGDMVTIATDPKPGRCWVYTGYSFVQPDEWARRRVVDYGVRPEHIASPFRRR